VVQRLNAEVNAILAQPDAVDALEKQGLVVTPGSPEVLARLVQSETARWSNVIKIAGIQAD
jgi:tripartite-type tricarboxylate transporter receptor subunit TctC